MRVIVTGERDWDDVKAVCDALDQEYRRWMLSQCGEFTVVHGACFPEKAASTGRRPPVSVDWIADVWARDRGLEPESHPADWSAHGASAGPRRNRAMAARGASVCLAFWSGKIERSGTLNAMSECAKRGIPIRVTTKATR